jgi:undecaprenyl-diphosphatase
VDVFGGLVLGVSISLLAFKALGKLYEDADKRYRFSLIVGVVALVLGCILAILLQAEAIDEVAFSDLMKTLALSGGGYLGFALEVKKINYKTDGNVAKKLIRYVVGLAGVLVIMSLKLVIPSSIYFLGSLVRYALIGFWATGFYPFIGKSLF